ncbi:hypothetical protein BpHYR1_028234 [Brachionus plicatilis]|uniref:Uncharacterized protein n=1 Tax=Brachionus plicatilis TaxID=10195 RepID=A0A3M7R640_BRAPC|nr:hypothetical protein BpHYR1_028234 [Brachionus plicatilis]
MSLIIVLQNVSADKNLYHPMLSRLAVFLQIINLGANKKIFLKLTMCLGFNEHYKYVLIFRIFEEELRKSRGKKCVKWTIFLIQNPFNYLTINEEKFLSVSLARFGLRMFPPMLKVLSTEAEVAGVDWKIPLLSKTDSIESFPHKQRSSFTLIY